MTFRKKIIEVALPLDAINEQSAREKEPFTRDHPRAMHVWWSRKPVAAALGVLIAQLVDDPSTDTDKFPTVEAQDRERERVFSVIRRIVDWDNARDHDLFNEARELIGDSEQLQLMDPFAGGGSIPLAANKLGMRTVAIDVNPVAALLNTLQVDWPARFVNFPPIFPEADRNLTDPIGLSGLAEDVTAYGGRLVETVREDLGKLFPAAIDSTGRERPVVAWIWCRTVQCQNPACGSLIPLLSHWWLRRKKGAQTWLRVQPEALRPGASGDLAEVVSSETDKPPPGTVTRSGASCVVCGDSIPLKAVRSLGVRGEIGQRLLAVAVETTTGRGKDYLTASSIGALPPMDQDQLDGLPETLLPDKALGFSVQNYGFRRHRDLFTPRQALCLAALMDGIEPLNREIFEDARNAGIGDISDGRAASSGGMGPQAYADTVCAFVAVAVSRWAAFNNSLANWNSTNENVAALFAMQVLSMTWNFAEINPFHGSPAVFPRIEAAVKWMPGAVVGPPGKALAAPAQSISLPPGVVVCTDPPYFDNIGYGYLADFFYVWLRRGLSGIAPEFFSTILTPKADELLPPDLSLAKAREAFEANLLAAFRSIRESHSSDYPMTVFYAYKQQEDTSEGGRASTGWELMLEALISAGWQITATWPIRTERMSRARSQGSNALASSVVLVCRRRDANGDLADRREFIRKLRLTLPQALDGMKKGNLAAVDVSQAAIGPGMEIYSGFDAVIEADGSAMGVGAALEIINRTLDEVLGGVESELDLESRFALEWFTQYGFNDGPYGVAENIARAKNTAVTGAVDAGIAVSRAGRVRLVSRGELPDDWDPRVDRRLVVWELTQHLVHRLQAQGERAAAELLKLAPTQGDTARDLAYRLFAISERRGWQEEAAAYNGLVVAWPALDQAAHAARSDAAEQTAFDV